MTTSGGQKAEEYKEELTTTYRKLDRALADMYYQLHSGKGRKDQVVIPSEENRQLLLAEYEALSAQVDRLDTPAPYFPVMKHHLKALPKSCSGTFPPKRVSR